MDNNADLILKIGKLHSVSIDCGFFLFLESYKLPFPTNSTVSSKNREAMKRRPWPPTLHAAALCLLVEMVQRGSYNVAVVAGACGAAVRTGSRHCCVGFRSSASAAMQSGTYSLRHLNASAARWPRLCCSCIQEPSEIQLPRFHKAMDDTLLSLMQIIYLHVPCSLLGGHLYSHHQPNMEHKRARAPLIVTLLACP